ncbi:RNA-directed DNA polymerase, eukaryota, reverse transcriptase zinc-binding domain protein, partial [Tanacetum coccineum]
MLPCIRGTLSREVQIGVIKSDFLETVKSVWEKDIKGKLNAAQSILDSNPHNMEHIMEAIKVYNEYTSVAEDELKLLHQKVRIQWLKEGDKNTSYFHRILKSRKHQGRVEFICGEDGSRYEGREVAGQFVKHFHSFLGTKHSVINMSFLGDIVSLKLTEEEVADMIIEVNDKEIKEAIFDIDSDKAAGRDGYSSCFFKKSWEIVGKDVCKAIKEFFITGKLLGKINATLIALVPKVDTPEKHESECIPSWKTHPGEHSHCPGVTKGIQQEEWPKKMCNEDRFKKVYDTINWDFIQDVLTAVGFHNTMIKWIMTIMTCITSTKFSICVNGEINGYFNGGRGLRQGDPISPYLFTMVMEVFNMIMIKNVKESGKFRYHHGCKELKLTHMCFADDLLVLCKGDIESVKVVKKTIEEFSKVCGLFPNINKSTIFFGNIKEEDKADMLQVLPFKCGKLPMRYLGVLLLAKRLGVGD